MGVDCRVSERTLLPWIVTLGAPPSCLENFDCISCWLFSALSRLRDFIVVARVVRFVVVGSCHATSPSDALNLCDVTKRNLVFIKKKDIIKRALDPHG